MRTSRPSLEEPSSCIFVRVLFVWEAKRRCSALRNTDRAQTVSCFTGEKGAGYMGYTAIALFVCRWFTHFYVWGLLWNAWLLCVSLGVCHSYWRIHSLYEWALPHLGIANVRAGLCSVWQLEVVIAMAMVCLQIGRRLYECLFVSTFSDARIHWLHYVLGVYFYTAIGPVIFLHLDNGTCECLVSLASAGLNFPCFFFNLEAISEMVANSSSSPSCLLHLLVHHCGLYHIVGTCLFMWSWWHQFRCTVILSHLRSQDPLTKSHTSQRHRSSYAYGVPRGDWFELVSSPHYLAEVIIYSALFLIMRGENLYWLLVILFVIMVLSLSARQTHSWYKRKFKEYPVERCAMFPWIY